MYIEVALVLVIFVLLKIIFDALLYIQRQSRWYYLRTTEFCEDNRDAILAINKGNVVGEQFYREAEYARINASIVSMPGLLKYFLDNRGTCPCCHQWQRCPPQCQRWTDQLKKRNEEKKDKEEKGEETHSIINPLYWIHRECKKERQFIKDITKGKRVEKEDEEEEIKKDKGKEPIDDDDDIKKILFIEEFITLFTAIFKDIIDLLSVPLMLLLHITGVST
jgi:hypothetical protein